VSKKKVYKQLQRNFPNNTAPEIMMASDNLKTNLKKNQNDWEGAGKFLDETMRGGGGAYNSTLLLIRARCFQQRGQVNSIN
jgi:hypothetical protein